MNFKDFIAFCEQPHAYSKEPFDVMLGGRLYQDIRGIDPRIEQFPDKETKFKFFRLHISDRVPIFFLDDKGQAYQIDDQGIITLAAKADPERTMPNYWHQKAQFRTGDSVIDNLMDPQSKPLSATG